MPGTNPGACACARVCLGMCQSEGAAQPEREVNLAIQNKRPKGKRREPRCEWTVLGGGMRAWEGGACGGACVRSYAPGRGVASDPE